MGWTSPLPAVRMRAAMVVSAVVATCRGRLRRGAIREEVLAGRTNGFGAAAVKAVNPNVSERCRLLYAVRARK